MYLKENIEVCVFNVIDLCLPHLCWGGRGAITQWIKELARKIVSRVS